VPEDRAVTAVREVAKPGRRPFQLLMGWLTNFLSRFSARPNTP